MEGRKRAELKDSIVKFVIENRKRDYLIRGLYASLQEPTQNIDLFITILAVSYTHLTLPTTPYV